MTVSTKKVCDQTESSKSNGNIPTRADICTMATTYIGNRWCQGMRRNGTRVRTRNRRDLVALVVVLGVMVGFVEVFNSDVGVLEKVAVEGDIRL